MKDSIMEMIMDSINDAIYLSLELVFHCTIIRRKTNFKTFRSFLFIHVFVFDIDIHTCCCFDVISALWYYYNIIKPFYCQIHFGCLVQFWFCFVFFVIVSFESVFFSNSLLHAMMDPVMMVSLIEPFTGAWK